MTPAEAVSLFLPHTVTPQHAIAHAQAAERAGFAGVMLADSLLREVTTTMAAIAARTERLLIGSAVAPMWTRNPATIAATAATLDALAPGRIVLGLGAWWEPIAAKTGIRRVAPIAAMREVVQAVRALLAGEEVTYHGRHVDLDAVALDDVGTGRPPAEVPILVGATGPQMLELAGAVADGVVMNYLISPAATADAAALVARGRAKVADADDGSFRRWQLVACSVANDRNTAIDRARPLVARALGQQPHIMRASGVDPDLIARVHDAVPWPATDADVAAIAHLVPDEVVDLLTASGTVDDCAAAIDRYRSAGCDHPILFPLDDGSIDGLIRAFG